MKLIKKKMTDVEITINNLVNEWVGLLKMSWSISIIKDSTQYKFRNRIEAGEFNSYGRIRNDLLNGNLISSFSVLNSLFVSSTDFIPYVMASQINPGRFAHLSTIQTQTVERSSVEVSGLTDFKDLVITNTYGKRWGVITFYDLTGDNIVEFLTVTDSGGNGTLTIENIYSSNYSLNYSSDSSFNVNKLNSYTTFPKSFMVVMTEFGAGTPYWNYYDFVLLLVQQTQYVSLLDTHS